MDLIKDLIDFCIYHLETYGNGYLGLVLIDENKNIKLIENLSIQDFPIQDLEENRLVICKCCNGLLYKDDENKFYAIVDYYWCTKIAKDFKKDFLKVVYNAF